MFIRIEKLEDLEDMLSDNLVTDINKIVKEKDDRIYESELYADNMYIQMSHAITEINDIISEIETADRIKKSELIKDLKLVINTLENY